MAPERSLAQAPVFATMLLAALLAVGTGAMGIAAAREAFGFMGSLNLPGPPLGEVAPRLGPSSPPLARRVVLVMVDGLRLDTSYGRPFIDGLRARGVDARMTSSFPTLSVPSYVAMTTGVPPGDSGVRMNLYPYVVRLDSIMARVKTTGMKVAYVSDEADSIPRLFGDTLETGGVSPWPGGLERAIAGALRADAGLVMIWIGDVDRAGHDHGGASRQYRAAARAVDSLLARSLADLNLDRDAIIVLADHGHVDGGGHGGVEPEAVEVPLVLAGAGVVPGVTIVDAKNVDVAATVAALLGVPAPGHSLGRTLVEALALTPADRDRRVAADLDRVATLDAFLADSRQDALDRAEVARGRRGLLAAGLLALVIALAIYTGRRRWATFDRRVLLVAMPAFPVSFYSLLATFENWLSPSMLPERGDIPGKLFAYGAIAAVGHLAAAWVSLAGRKTPRARLAAAAGITLVGVCGALLTVGLSWWLSVPTLVRELPEPHLLMLVPAAYVAVALYAASALVTLAIEYTVFMARATRSLWV
jgi:hypothetical protein